MRAVKHISAEFLMFQFSFLNSSTAKIIAGVINYVISSRK